MARSTQDKRFRQLAEAVAAGETRFQAGKRLGLDRTTIKAWWSYSSFQILVRVLRADRQAAAAIEARAALDRGDTVGAIAAASLRRNKTQHENAPGHHPTMQSGRENAGETGNQSTNAPTVALCGVRPDSPVSTDHGNGSRSDGL